MTLKTYVPWLPLASSSWCHLPISSILEVRWCSFACRLGFLLQIFDESISHSGSRKCHVHIVTQLSAEPAWSFWESGIVAGSRVVLKNTCLWTIALHYSTLSISKETKIFEPPRLLVSDKYTKLEKLYLECLSLNALHRWFMNWVFAVEDSSLRSLYELQKMINRWGLWNFISHCG